LNSFDTFEEAVGNPDPAASAAVAVAAAAAAEQPMLATVSQSPLKKSAAAAAAAAALAGDPVSDRWTLAKELKYKLFRHNLDAGDALLCNADKSLLASILETLARVNGHLKRFKEARAYLLRAIALQGSVEETPSLVYALLLDELGWQLICLRELHGDTGAWNIIRYSLAVKANLLSTVAENQGWTDA
jgi:hypothetical protein